MVVFRGSHRISRALAWSLMALALSGFAAGCKKKTTPVAPTPTPDPPAPAPHNTVNPPNTTGNMDARTSMRTPANSGSLVLDDFVSTVALTVGRVNWQGIYCAEVPGRVPPAATATGFQVAFFPDAGGSPNRTAPIQSVVYATPRTAETLDFTFQGNCGTAITGFGLYNYSVALDTPFVAQPNVRYWLSVQAQVSYLQAGNPDFIFWGWRNGTPNNNRSVQINPAGTVTEYSTDRAYSLAP